MKKRILLLRLDAIGDFVLFTSVLPHLRNFFKDDHITLAVHPNVEPLAKGCPYADQVRQFDPKKYSSDPEYVRQVTQQVEHKFDIAINTMYTRTWQSDNIIARTHAPVKIGFECIDKDGEEQRRTKEQVVYTQLTPATKEWMFEIERYQGLLNSLNQTSEKINLKPEFWITSADRSHINNFLQSEIPGSKRFAIISPGGGFNTKLWNSDGFGKVADWLVSNHDTEVVFVGTEIEKPLIAGITGNMKRKSHSTAGLFSLPQIVALTERAAMYIGIDTAGFHIAWASGIPAVGIFGGGHFGRFTPALPHVRIIHVPMDCYYCYWHCIYDEVKCITSITPEMVMKEVETVLHQEKIVEN